MLVPLHHLCIDGASGKVQRVGEVLVVWNSFVVAHVEASVVALDAWSYVGFLALQDLCEPLWVSKEVACKANAVYLAFCN